MVAVLFRSVRSSRESVIRIFDRCGGRSRSETKSYYDDVSCDSFERGLTNPITPNAINKMTHIQGIEYMRNTFTR